MSIAAAAAPSSWTKFPGGLEHRTLGEIDAIGVDEIQYAKGHTYLTLVYQIDIGGGRIFSLTVEFPGLLSELGDATSA